MLWLFVWIGLDSIRRYRCRCRYPCGAVGRMVVESSGGFCILPGVCLYACGCALEVDTACSCRWMDNVFGGVIRHSLTDGVCVSLALLMRARNEWCCGLELQDEEHTALFLLRSLREIDRMVHRKRVSLPPQFPPSLQRSLNSPPLSSKSLRLPFPKRNHQRDQQQHCFHQPSLRCHTCRFLPPRLSPW